MTDYSSAVIYTITTGDDTYIGSSVNYYMRQCVHNTAITKDLSSNTHFNLYKKIRENGGKWEMKKYKDFPCKNRTELRFEEQQVINKLFPTLNKRNAYVTEDTSQYKKDWYLINKEKVAIRNKNYRKTHQVNKEYHKKYYEANKAKTSEKITCECGCVTGRCNIKQHRKTKKHLNLMKELDK